MTTDFTSLMRRLAPNGEGYAVDIPADWMQGRTTYGGLSAALCLEAARRAVDDAPPLRSALIAFVGPAGGPATMTAEVLRAGRSVTFVRGDLMGEKGLATTGTFAFGAPRPSRFERRFIADPGLPPPEDCDVFMPEGMGPAFAQHYDQRLAKGGRPVSGSSEHDHYIWVRHRDAAARDMTALLALADMPPPALMPMFTEPAPISSMTWIVTILEEDCSSEDGWYLLQSRAENAGAGYSSQDMIVWDRSGRAVIAGRQSVAIFA